MDHNITTTLTQTLVCDPTEVHVRKDDKVIWNNAVASFPNGSPFTDGDGPFQAGTIHIVRDGFRPGQVFVPKLVIAPSPNPTNPTPPVIGRIIFDG